MSNKIKILLIGHYLPDRQLSMEYFAKALLSLTRNANVEIERLRPPFVFGRFSFGHRSLFKWLGYFDKFLLLPIVLLLKMNSYDVLHILDHSYSWLTFFLGKKSHLVTCHDLIAVRSARSEFEPYHKTRLSGKVQQWLIVRGLMRADWVACVSNASKDDLLRIARRDSVKSICVRNGMNRSFEPLAKAKALRILNRRYIGHFQNEIAPFFLHVGVLKWYKNRTHLIEAFNLLTTKKRANLVIAGDDLTDEEMALITSAGTVRRIFQLGRVNDDELNALYSTCFALVFPSITEGFGWPIIEAQASGAPVIVSDVEPMRSIAGDSAKLTNPFDAAITMQAMIDLLEETPQQREERIHQGILNANEYSLDKMKEEYQSLYDRIYKQSCVASL